MDEKEKTVLVEVNRQHNARCNLDAPQAQNEASASNVEQEHGLEPLNTGLRTTTEGDWVPSPPHCLNGVGTPGRRPVPPSQVTVRLF